MNELMFDWDKTRLIFIIDLMVVNRVYLKAFTKNIRMLKMSENVSYLYSLIKHSGALLVI